MERTLTWRDLNRALLARQCLDSRARADAPAVLERMAGLQAQYAPSMYIGLWSRIEGFERESLTRLLEDREVVQATLLRATIHLTSRADYWPFLIAIRDARREWYHRVVRTVTVAELAAAADSLRERLRERPLRRTEIDQLYGAEVRGGVGMHLDMVRVPPSGTWARRRADLFGLAEDWVGPPDIDVDAARELLVRRYLGGFGPAHRSEIADWAGLSVADVTEVLARLELCRFRDERGREVLVDLPDQPLPAPDTPAPVRFLPWWDAALLTHARRSLILPEEHRAKVFHVRMPQSIGTFLVDGQVAGTWKVSKAGVVSWEPFGTLPASVRRQVDAEAGALTAFHSTS